MLQKRLPLAVASLAILILFTDGVVKAADEKPAGNGCKSLPNFSALKSALDAATATETSGLNNQMWATVVDRDGVVCAVAFTGVNRGAQWPGSRVISAQKANTANAFSLDSSSSNSGSGQPNGLALSTANLYSAVQPRGQPIRTAGEQSCGHSGGLRWTVIQLRRSPGSYGRTQDWRS